MRRNVCYAHRRFESLFKSVIISIMTSSHYKRGLISSVLIIVIALITLGYFNIDVKAIFANQTVLTNLKYGYNLSYELITKAFHYGWTFFHNHIPFFTEIYTNIKSLTQK